MLHGVWTLIPARDEAQRLDGVLERVRAVLPEGRVLVVDGHSSDPTVEIARRHGARVVEQPGRGYADALAMGYRTLLAAGAERVVQLDADGQHPPEEAPRLLAALADADFVIGSRLGTRSPGAWHRRAGNAVLSQAVRVTSGAVLHDVTSGYWACGPAAIALFAASLGEGVADANVRVLAVRAGLGVRELPVTMSERSDGASMHDGWQGARNLLRSLRALR